MQGEQKKWPTVHCTEERKARTLHKYVILSGTMLRQLTKAAAVAYYYSPFHRQVYKSFD